MNKLTLKLCDLAVESFDTTSVSQERGTVRGEQQLCTCPTACTCPGCPTCAATCPDTCYNTCENTCGGASYCYCPSEAYTCPVPDCIHH